jgi:hypothetical protein
MRLLGGDTMRDRMATKKKTTSPDSRRGVIAEKVIPDSGQRSPEISPVFSNEVQIIRVGSDVYLDFGVVPADDALRARTAGKVRFIVRERIAMSVNSFATLRTKVEEVFQKMPRGEELLDDELRHK